MRRLQALLWFGVGIVVLASIAIGVSGVSGLSAPVESTANGTINVSGTIDVSFGEPTNGSGPPQLDSSLAGPPTDLDGDGTYEDLNGNGRGDFDDVVQFFKYIRNPAITDHVSAYDYNENGRIDFVDLVELFKEI